MSEIGKLPNSVHARLQKYSTVNAGTGCREWHGHKDSDGYGILLVTGDGWKKNKRAHRLAYHLAYGPVPAGKIVCHRCDNPSCIEPSHLFAGTWNDNVQDMRRKGRYRAGGKPHPGASNGRAKLTAAQVLEIRAKVASGVSAASLAPALGLHPSAVQRAASGKAWRCLNQ